MSSRQKQNKNKKNNKGRILVSVLLAFLIMVGITCLSVAGDMALGICRPGVVATAVTQSGYYSGVYTSLDEPMKQVITAAGLPEEALYGIYTEDQVRLAGGASVKKALNGNGADADTEELEKVLTNNINIYLKMQGITLDSDLEESIAQVVTQAAAVYKSEVSFWFGNQYEGILGDLRLVRNILAVFGLLFTVAASILLFGLYHFRFHALEYLSGGVLGGVLVHLAASLSVHSQIGSMITDVGEGYYRDFLRVVTEKWLQPCLILAAAGLLLYIITLILGKQARKRGV